MHAYNDKKQYAYKIHRYTDRRTSKYRCADIHGNIKVHGQICMYTDSRWYKLVFNVQYFRQPDPIDRLDVSILQQFVLEPIFGIKDPRTDERIGFVGGRRGTAELERMVDSGEAKIAFSMFPTTMDDLFAVSDMGEIMPPKSTWFEPKLRDGLVVHPI